LHGFGYRLEAGVLDADPVPARLHRLLHQGRLAGIDPVDVDLAERVSRDGEEALRSTPAPLDAAAPAGLRRHAHVSRMRTVSTEAAAVPLPAPRSVTSNIRYPPHLRHHTSPIATGPATGATRGTGLRDFAAESGVVGAPVISVGASARRRERGRAADRDLAGEATGCSGQTAVAKSSIVGKRWSDSLARAREMATVSDRDARPLGARERRLFVNVLVDDRMHRVAAERQLGGDHAVADHTQGVLVGAAIHRGALPLLAPCSAACR